MLVDRAAGWNTCIFCIATFEEGLGTDKLAADTVVDVDFFGETKGFSVTCWYCFCESFSSVVFSPSPPFIAVSGGEAVAVLLEAEVSFLDRVFPARALSTVALPGFKRENLDKRSVLLTALVTLSSVFLIRDMRLLFAEQQWRIVS